MTQAASIAKALLDGKELSIMNGFYLFGCTNIPREIGRSIERKFDVNVTKKQIHFVSRYGQKGIYFSYSLKKSGNEDGILKMITYIITQKK